MVNILCTGIAGCGEREYLEKFSDYCREKKKDINIIHVTDVVLEIAKKTNPEINKYNMLNFPKTTRDLWYQNAFNTIEKRLKRDAVNIINIHVTYWWKDGPDEVIRADILNSFFQAINPLFFVQFVDIAEKIKERVDRVVEHVGRALPLEDIYRWQDLESYVVQIFASINKKPFYLIPKSQPADTLFRLIFTKDLKIYFSFPMTFMRGGERKKIERFIKELEKSSIIFSPEKVEEYPFYPGRLRRISGDTTIKKDYRLINQSDMVVAYFPKVVYTGGVTSEINYASSIGKAVYLVWPEKKYSPFTTYPVKKVFFSKKGCIKEIKALAEQRKQV